MELKERRIKIEKALKELELEISSTFRMQAKFKDGTEALLMTAEHLEELAKQKRELNNQLQDSIAESEGLMEARDVISGMEARILDFKKGFPKATPAVRRRLIRKVLGNLYYRPGKIEIEYNLPEGETENVNPINGSKNNKKRDNAGAFEFDGEGKKAVGSDFILPFANMRDGRNGWGSRTRTCE